VLRVVEVQRHGPAHDAKADKSDLHVLSPESSPQGTKAETCVSLRVRGDPP
jgi:hypothetical protein